MAPMPTLPAEYRFRFFASTRNSGAISNYSVPPQTWETKLAGLGGASTSKGKALVSSDSLLPSNGPPCSTKLIHLSDDNSTVQKSSPKKKKKQDPIDVTCRWQEVWAGKFLWAQGHFVDGNLTSVECLACCAINGRPKLIVPKLDNLEKHEGKRVAVVENAKRGVLKGQVYIDKECTHLKNVSLFASRRPKSIIQQVHGTMASENRHKGVQFSSIFSLLQNGRPMCDYTSSRSLLEHLKVKHMPRKHWCESSSWEIAQYMHLSILAALVQAIHSTRFISVTADEVTGVDNTQWLSVHVYVVKDFVRVPLLLHLGHITQGCTFDNILSMITTALMSEGGMSKEEIAGKVVSCGFDGASVFQGSKTGVTTMLQQSWSPFTLGMHCCSHRTNLAVQTLSSYPLVMKLEVMMQTTHKYFSKSPKRHIELTKLAAIMETKGNKILRNVKTRWISMLSPAKRIMAEYRTLLLKMVLDMSTVDAAKSNFDVLRDFGNLLSLSCILPLLSIVHCLIKFSQSRDVYICDFLAAVKICQSQLATYFIDSATQFNRDLFPEFYSLLECKHESITMRWLENEGSTTAHLVFQLGDHTIFAQCQDNVTGLMVFVTREAMNRCEDTIKAQMTEIAQSLIDEFDTRFPSHEILDAFGILYHQYWNQVGAEDTFPHHLAMLKRHYTRSRTIFGHKGEGGLIATNILSSENLDRQQALFKTTMRSNAAVACAPPFDVNPLTKLWRTISSSRLLKDLISEYILLAEMGTCFVLGSVEDERCFSSLKFLKSSLRNSLGKNLPMVVRMYGQKYFSLKTFPYNEAIQAWKEGSVHGRYGDA